jgi:transposase InsO family protein
MVLSNVFTYMQSVVDRLVRWPINIPIPDKAAKTVAREFLSGWAANFGMPTDVLSDRGREFLNQLLKDLSNLLGFNLHHTTSYHSQANGAVKRFHRTVKAAIMAHENDPA